MGESRESESMPPPVGARPRGWWWRPFGWSIAAIYAGQLVPFVAGPLNECGHCMLNYLKYFAMVPGAPLGLWVTDWLRHTIPGANAAITGNLGQFLIPGVLVFLGLLYSTTMITARTRDKWRWIWLGLLAALSAGNALFFSAALRT